MENKRFVPINGLKKLLEQRDEIDNEIRVFTTNPFCGICGDTEPKYGFYPLISNCGLMCNRCGLTDENYLRIFGEPKEVISKMVEYGCK